MARAWPVRHHARAMRAWAEQVCVRLAMNEPSCALSPHTHAPLVFSAQERRSPDLVTSRARCTMGRCKVEQ